MIQAGFTDLLIECTLSLYPNLESVVEYPLNVYDWLCTAEKLIPAASAAVPARQIRAPMTKAEWEKQQSIVRRVHDPTTGRDRFLLP